MQESSAAVLNASSKVSDIALTGAAKAQSVLHDAVDAAQASKSVRTAAKVAVVGGGIAVGGTLAGLGVQQAIVAPFKQLGLVTTDANGNQHMTTTGKIIVFSVVGLALGLTVLYAVKR